MLRITSHSSEAGVETLIVEGSLVGPWVDQFRRAVEAAHGRCARVELDLAGVRFATGDGAAALRESVARGLLVRRGSHFVNELLAAPPAGSGAGRAARPAARARGQEPPSPTAKGDASLGRGAGPAADESAFVQALRTGCPVACELLVREHAAPMRAIALRILHDESEADDVVQEAFLAALRALERFEGRSALPTWLHRITANAALMRLRARKARPVASLDELLPEFTEGGAWSRSCEPWKEPEQDPLLREELCARVRECIARLPEKHRIPLLMRDIEGLRNDAIAERLGISVNAAKIRVHRARQAVRALLEPLMLEASV